MHVMSSPLDIILLFYLILKLRGRYYISYHPLISLSSLLAQGFLCLTLCFDDNKQLLKY